MGKATEQGLQVVGLGMTTLDVLIRLRDMPTWERGAPLEGFGLDGGGPVGTAIVAAARLGARAGLIGTVGNDTAAELKERSLRQDGIDLSRMVRRNAPDDQIVIVYVHADSGERVFSAGGRQDHQLLQVDELDRDYITSAQILHLDGFHTRAALQAARWMQEAGKTVVLDGHKTAGSVHSSIRELVAHADVLISGSGFAEALTGQHDIWDAGKAILNMGPRIFVQTEGEHGSFTITTQERFHVPAFDVRVVDTTGAGDVFHGAFIFGLLQEWSLPQIVRFSTAVSAIKCTCLGGRVGIPCLDQVLAFLDRHNMPLIQGAS